MVKPQVGVVFAPRRRGCGGDGRPLPVPCSDLKPRGRPGLKGYNPSVIGKTLAHYRILESLGKGGMGEVYLAEDSKLNRRIAPKIMPPEMARDPERRRRFEREAQAVAALDHPNIVTIHSVEEVDGTHFLTRERLEGETLNARVPKVIENYR